MIPDHILWVLDKLSEWKETFVDDEDGCWELINELENSLEGGTCTKEEYDTILFHLWQSIGQED